MNYIWWSSVDTYCETSNMWYFAVQRRDFSQSFGLAKSCLTSPVLYAVCGEVGHMISLPLPGICFIPIKSGIYLMWRHYFTYINVGCMKRQHCWQYLLSLLINVKEGLFLNRVEAWERKCLFLSLEASKPPLWFLYRICIMGIPSTVKSIGNVCFPVGFTLLFQGFPCVSLSHGFWDQHQVICLFFFVNILYDII